MSSIGRVRTLANGVFPTGWNMYTSFNLTGICCPTPDMEKIKIVSERRDFTGTCIYAYGDYVFYICNEGSYPMSTDGRSSCQADGKWDPAIPSCQAGKNAKGTWHHPFPDSSRVSMLFYEEQLFKKKRVWNCSSNVTIQKITVTLAPSKLLIETKVYWQEGLQKLLPGDITHWIRSFRISFC